MVIRFMVVSNLISVCRYLYAGVSHNSALKITVFALSVISSEATATSTSTSTSTAYAAMQFDAAPLAHIQQQYGDGAAQLILSWQRLLDKLQGQPEAVVLNKVNRFFNQVRFLADKDHWGKLDYWATPLELLATNGGDCEDFAIAKYFSLRWF